MKGTSAEQNRPGWADFKASVWHAGFKFVLDSVDQLSRVGFAIICGDEIMRTLFPFIHILSADYEEQCVVVLYDFMHKR